MAFASEQVRAGHRENEVFIASEPLAKPRIGRELLVAERVHGLVALLHLQVRGEHDEDDGGEREQDEIGDPADVEERPDHGSGVPPSPARRGRFVSIPVRPAPGGRSRVTRVRTSTRSPTRIHPNTTGASSP